MFTGLVVGVPQILDHDLNQDGFPLIPDFVAPALGPFVVTANGTTITVIRTATSPGPNVDVWVAHLHTILRAFGANGAFQPDGLSVRPFILNQAGGSGPGGGVSALALWGNDNLTAGPGTVFLTPGRGQGNAASSRDFTFNAPRAGVFQKFFARHNAAGGNGSPVDYRLRVNGIDAASITLLTGVIGSASNLVSTVPVSMGDLIDFVGVKAGAIGGGNTDTEISAEFV